MDMQEPEARKGGHLMPILIIVFLIGCLAYLAVTGKERITFGCEATPPAPHH
jgi:hypothetical protein